MDIEIQVHCTGKKQQICTKLDYLLNGTIKTGDLKQ